MNNKTTNTLIPTRRIGPIKIVTANVTEEIIVPLATFETTLMHSVNRGARVSRLTNGIKVHLVHDTMTRSIILEGKDTETVANIITELANTRGEISAIVKSTSSICEFQDLSSQIIGNLLFLRLAFSTGDAAGHNMTTKASDAIADWIIKKYPQLKYVSVSGNYCVDKKNSCVNGILGRGKYVIAEILIPREICQTVLHTTPEAIINLNIKKNLFGPIIAGSVRTANAHFANMLLAFYLATGQDAANIIEGSQGFVHTDVVNEQLYFTVTVPNIIVGSVGNGKDLKGIKENLQNLGCLEKRKIGQNAKRLAMIAAATVLCGELSLLAALTNRGELIKGHIKLERKRK